MDEPASALDPIATAKIEDLVSELREVLTIVIVTHNMQHAARVSQRTGFFYMGRQHRRARPRGTWHRPRQVGALMKSMSEQAQQMVRDALDAFVGGDVTKAEEVLSRDDEVDDAYGRVLDAMTEFMRETPAEIPSAIRVIKVAKYIERIADHATNIAEEVIFMVRGDDVRHLRTHPPPKAV